MEVYGLGKEIQGPSPRTEKAVDGKLKPCHLWPVLEMLLYGGCLLVDWVEIDELSWRMCMFVPFIFISIGEIWIEAWKKHYCVFGEDVIFKEALECLFFFAGLVVIFFA